MAAHDVTWICCDAIQLLATLLNFCRSSSTQYHKLSFSLRRRSIEGHIAQSIEYIGRHTTSLYHAWSALGAPLAPFSRARRAERRLQAQWPPPRRGPAGRACKKRSTRRVRAGSPMESLPCRRALASINSRYLTIYRAARAMLQELRNGRMNE
eukprot:5431973-Pleurochrysis_carterae.AAC.3